MFSIHCRRVDKADGTSFGALGKLGAIEIDADMHAAIGGAGVLV
jgi:hypothetical protein